MKVLFFGTYDPAYSRNRVLIKGLEHASATIVHCRVLPGLLWQLRLLLRYWSLLISHSSFDILFVAFPGQEMMLLARLLTRKPIVFDAFTSHYEGYVLDRKTTRPGSLRARWYRWLDRTACRLADVCLADTQAHIDFFVGEYGLPREKFHRIFVGTDTAVFQTAKTVPNEPFTVHFHGTNIPLQGIPYIRQAEALLKNESIKFNIIGTMGDRVPYEALPGLMASAHVCLGIFGDTVKTQRVIPNKVYEALAVGRPVITADTAAARELLDDTSVILIPTANAQALADAILRLKNDPALRERIGAAGHDVLMRRATPAILGKQVLNIYQNLHDHTH